MRETVTARSTLKIGASANDTWRAVAATGREIRAQRGNMTRRARKSGAYLPGMRRRCGRRPSERVGHSVATRHARARKSGAYPLDTRRRCGRRPAERIRHSVAIRQARARKSGAYLPSTRRRCGRRPAERVQSQRGDLARRIRKSGAYQPGTRRRCGGAMSGTKDLLHDKTHNDGGGVRRACAAQYFRR